MYSISIKNNGSFFDIQNESKKVKDPVLYEALNSCGTLSFDTQIEDEAYEEYERLKTRVLVKEDGAIQFVGRLLRTSIDFQNTKSLVFEGELALLNDVLYPPYAFSGTIAEFLTNIINYYNSKCSTINQINIGRITVQDKNNYIARSNEEYSTCWQAISDKLIDLCGGYVSMRWVVVNGTIYRYLDYLDNPGTDASQSIEYAKNILDVGQEIDAGDICTVLYPFGAKDESTGKKIDITSVNGGKNYIESANKSIYGVVEKTIEFEDVTLPSNLLSKAKAYLEEHDSSISSLTVKAIDLHVIDDSYVRFNVGDSIHVSSPPNSIDTIMMISERTRNLNNPDKDELTLGKVIDTFTSSVDRPSMTESDENALNYVDIEYGLSDSSTVAPTSWSSESPVWTAGKYIWQRTKCVYINGTITYSNVACIQGAKGEDGAPGADGKDGADGANGKDGINGTNGKDGTSSYFFVRYSANADGSGMTIEPASNTKYMGVATNTVNSAPTSASSYKWSLIKGSDGTNGTPGADGSSSYLHIKYSNDGKTFTANSGEELGTWIGTLVDNKLEDSTTFSDYTWKKYVGADGANGKDGINGTNGKDGTSSYFFVRYSANADGSGMTIEPASNTKYMGVATNTVNSAPTSASSYKWSLIKGSDGTNGTPGADGSSSYLHIKYSNDGKTFTANSGEELGTWIGTLVDNKLEDSTTFSDYTWKKYVGADGANGKDGINGTNGSNGADGRGISSIIEQYYLSSSNTTQTGGSWVTTCPAWKKGYYIWTRSKITWLNPTEVTYTTPTLAGAINSANENANNANENIPSESEIQTIAKQQTNMLLGSSGGYLEVLYDSNDKPTGFRIMDSPVASSAKNVILVNNNGIGFSNSGINGTFFNAWTIDGHLSADALYTGVIKDKNQLFSINLDTGEIKASNITLNTPNLVFGTYPNGQYIRALSTNDGVNFTGNGNISFYYSGTFLIRNDIGGYPWNMVSISKGATSTIFNLLNAQFNSYIRYANSITMRGYDTNSSNVINKLNLDNYAIGLTTVANYLSLYSQFIDTQYDYQDEVRLANLKYGSSNIANELILNSRRVSGGSAYNNEIQINNYKSDANTILNSITLSLSGISMYNNSASPQNSFTMNEGGINISNAYGSLVMYNDINLTADDDLRFNAAGGNIYLMTLGQIWSKPNGVDSGAISMYAAGGLFINIQGTKKRIYFDGTYVRCADAS